MLMREAAGFSSGQRFHHSYRLRFPTDSTATRTSLSLSLSLSLSFSHAIRSQKSRSDFSNYYFVSKALDPERLDLHGSTKRTFNWLLAERLFQLLPRLPSISETRASPFLYPGIQEQLRSLINLIIIEMEKDIVFHLITLISWKYIWIW